ncbi:MULTISPECIES: MlaD family protein [unclassified Nocardioides]|uniref:MlaD family protein n=1 Tax=unclassified Nocardioides TaxID=2615069 RepID=UPI0009F0189C|nr:MULTISPECIES: MlaD family protein [unclassified Nocardioides]GAW48255.1 virulence factor Mce family protein [Nocardioides sp. PD653-B2]GAW52903.1 virulence factor Mce family protein [Nocardioides sp. PD653]
MKRGIKVRIAAFLVLSAVGIVYIAGTYLGLVDRVLGRGITVHATLPTSGGLFEGSEVTYRGVKIGKVSSMHATEDGVRVDLALEDGTKLPLDSKMYVHNLSAVGEQYLDFEPPDDEKPYAEAGDTLTGTADSLPVDEGDLLVELDQFVSSVDKRSLQTVVKELGDMFENTGVPLQRLLDNGSEFVQEASDHTAETIRLLDKGKRVLSTQQGESENIRTLSHDLRGITRALADSDDDLETTLQGTPGTAREVDALLRDLEPTLPILLGNAVSINQVVVSHLAGVEQLLVTYPRTISAGFTGTPGDGYGHVNLQTDGTPPCTEGYKPRNEWRPPSDLTDSPIFPAQCASGPPYVMRGPKYSPGSSRNPSPGRLYRSSYDPSTGIVSGAVDAQGNPVRFVDQGNLSILGGDSWKWLLVGPVVSR